MLFEFLYFFFDFTFLALLNFLCLVVYFILRDDRCYLLLNLLFSVQIVEFFKAFFLKKIVDIADIFLDMRLSELINLCREPLQEVAVVGHYDEGSVELQQCRLEDVF